MDVCVTTTLITSLYQRPQNTNTANTPLTRHVVRLRERVEIHIVEPKHVADAERSNRRHFFFSATATAVAAVVCVLSVLCVCVCVCECALT
jgi:hypothetical protein